MKLLAPRILAAVLLTAPAALAHDHGPRFPFPPFPMPFPSFRIGTPRFSIEFGNCRPRHEHCWRYACEREWSPPVYESRVIGYDCHRRPIYGRVLVRAGCWVEVRYRVCDCGARVRC
jgi:hypothetical protein